MYTYYFNFLENTSDDRYEVLRKLSDSEWRVLLKIKHSGGQRALSPPLAVT